MVDQIRKVVTMVCMLLVLLVAGAGVAQALECGFVMRDNCDEICAGKKVLGCKNCGFWCEECDCGPLVDTKMVCCNMKGTTCDYASTVPDGLKWLSVEDCDRSWGGTGEKICPNEKCKKVNP